MDGSIRFRLAEAPPPAHYLGGDLRITRSALAGQTLPLEFLDGAVVRLMNPATLQGNLPLRATR